LHLDGISFRKIAKQFGCSKSKISRIVSNCLKTIPNSNHISKISCKYFKKGVLIVDGKYLHVKGYHSKIPLIWAFEEYSHDPLIHVLATAESYTAYKYLFLQLKDINFPLQVLVCDQHPSISLAAKEIYPKVKIQICLNHYKENIRRSLNSRSKPIHKTFVNDIVKLFDQKTLDEFSNFGLKLFNLYGNIPKYRTILNDINDASEYLLTHYKYRCPKTTNLAECFNSHLQARLRSIKGFESFNSAQLWLNAYVMNRRLTKFTDCTRKYRYLNGTAPIQHTAKIENRDINLLRNVV
jgi:transposase-like protein